MSARRHALIGALVAGLAATGACGGPPERADHITSRSRHTDVTHPSRGTAVSEPDEEGVEGSSPTDDVTPAEIPGIGDAPASGAREGAARFAEAVVAATAGIASLHETLQFSGNVYEDPANVDGVVELFVTPEGVTACHGVGPHITCALTTPEDLASDVSIAGTYGFHGAVDLGAQASAMADAVLTFADVTDEAESGAGERSYYMVLDASRVDPVAMGVDPALLAQIELISVLYLVDAQGIPRGHNVTMSAGSAVATVTTAIDMVNETIDILGR